MEEKENKGHLLLNIFILFIILLIGLYLYARYVEHDKLIMKEYKIESKKIPSNFSGTKIVHISDIYFGNTTDIKNIDNLVKNINKMKPDLILFTLYRMIGRCTETIMTLPLGRDWSWMKTTLASISLE